MSNSSPPIEEQHRFARSQTPESPRPVHVPEPANIPILRNQMDPVFNDTATYNIPSDQNFAHYGETLENPNYRSIPMEENVEFKKFFLEAENQIAHSQALSNASEPNTSASVADTLTASTAKHTNHSGPLSNSGQAETNPQLAPPQTTLDSSHPEVVTASQNVKDTNDSVDSGYVPSEENVASADTNPTSVSSGNKPDDGVDYQSLLDTISQSASTAPAADSITVLKTESTVPEIPHTTSLPSFPGLPPKPPPLQTQSVSTFPSSLDLSQYMPQPNAAPGTSQPSHQAATSGYDSITNGTKSSTISSDRTENAVSNPFAVGITNEQAIAMHMQNNRPHPKIISPPDPSELEPSDRPWSPKTQAIYDAFLEDERRYVTEGIWDRFPMGSRLFVGNLPSEKVTKRDLFHRFHRFGKLAQISIKQAYGFVQYHDAASCKAALDAEQGVELRGRKVHLEVSKPQKNTKGAGSSNNKAQQSQSQNHNRRRSRSPQRRSYSDFRDEPSRRREEYRNRRSPSPPRGYRRDERTGSRNGPRSPMYGSNYHTPQPAYDDEASLPYPRRDPRNVPDVQLIVMDTVDQAFINWIEDGFKRKGLQAATTWLNAKTPLPAVVKRQIVEGVQAVVKIASSHQVRSKIPLQVFDRSAGSSNVTFNEYADLDVPVAADVVIQARQKERPPPPPHYPPSMYPPQSPYTVSPNNSTGTSSPWGPPALHQFSPTSQHLHPYQHSPQQQNFRPPQSPYLNTPQSATAHQPNLQDLLANLKGGTAPPTPQSAHSAGQPYTPYGQPAQQFPHNPTSQPQYGQYSQPPAPQQQQGQPHNVQHIMDQLARYQR